MKRVVLMGTVILACAMAVVCAAVPEVHVEELSVGDAAGSFIHNVPDATQPPSNILNFHSVHNWCAPIAASNSVSSLDSVVSLDWAQGVTGGLESLDLSEYLGHFMATNGEGSPDRENAQERLPGTLSEDIGPGILDFAVWNGREPPNVPALEKEQVSWDAAWLDAQVGNEFLIDMLERFIAETGVPPILSFTYWNPIIVDKEEIGEEKALIYFAAWGEPLSLTETLHKENPKVPIEEWNEKQGIGHAVTAVGFLKGDPDEESEPLPNTLWVIVHDNWASTPENIAIPWKNVDGIVFFGGEPLFELLEDFQHRAEG